VAIVIVFGFFIIRYKKKRIPNEGIISKKQEGVDDIQDSQTSEKIFCPLCAEEISDEEGDYCSKCGGALK